MVAGSGSDDLAVDVTYAAARLQRTCLALTLGDTAAAASYARTDFPFVARRPAHPLPIPPIRPKVITLPKTDRDHRKVTLDDLTRLFVADGFVDRYTREYVVYPPALLLLSLLLPAELPYHPAWKVGVGHSLYWSLLATHDHIHSLARGGRDTWENWVTCSELTNEIKNYWSIEELGWELHPRDETLAWDGLLHWFVTYLDYRPNLLAQAQADEQWRTLATRILAWYNAARRVLKAGASDV